MIDKVTSRGLIWSDTGYNYDPLDQTVTGTDRRQTSLNHPVVSGRTQVIHWLSQLYECSKSRMRDLIVCYIVRGPTYKQVFCIFRNKVAHHKTQKVFLNIDEIVLDCVTGKNPRGAWFLCG